MSAVLFTTWAGVWGARIEAAWVAVVMGVVWGPWYLSAALTITTTVHGAMHAQPVTKSYFTPPWLTVTQDSKGL